MTEDREQPLVDLEKALNFAGLSMYSDEFAAELLAWFYIFGGANEAVVHDPVLSQALQACALKLGFIEGRGQPVEAVLDIWRAKHEELSICIAQARDFPDWLHRILTRYNLRTPRADHDYAAARRIALF